VASFEKAGPMYEIITKIRGNHRTNKYNPFTKELVGLNQHKEEIHTYYVVTQEGQNTELIEKIAIINETDYDKKR